ncbi:MAG: hypothetical protein RJA36_1295 [Pseudomonadota bacterium]
MAYTQADIDAFDAETDSMAAVESQTIADRSVKFRSLDERAAQRARMVAQMESAAGRTRTRYASTSKGV